MPVIPWTVERAGEEIKLEVDYEVSAYSAGNLTGPPEHCEPPSGGDIEQLEVYRDDDSSEFKLTDEEERALEAHIQDTHDFDGAYEEWGF